MASRRVRLRPLRDADFAFVYELMTSPAAGGRVRFAGATPSPNQVASSLWDSVLAQFLVEGASSGAPKGVVAITSANFRDAFAYLSVLASGPAAGSGLVAEATMLACNYAFCTWPFRKLYFEATERSYAAFASGLGRFFSEEGRLRQHVFWNQRYEDLLILAMYRETWAREAPRFLARAAADLDGAAPATTTASPPR
ncbi:MAG: GNAT family N-acetyltransferase [Acidimicrobiales bacterium]